MRLSPKTKDRRLTIAGQGRASQQEAVTYVRCGSSATEVVEATPPPLVRFASESGRRERASTSLLRANNGSRKAAELCRHSDDAYCLSKTLHDRGCSSDVPKFPAVAEDW